MLERFPLPASSSYSYAQRFGPEHLGTDIMAPLGTPVLAVESGRAWSNLEPKGGRVVYLDGESGARYYYGHLDSWQLQLISATQQAPLVVHAGDAIGTVGTSGNAAGRPPHLHFQVRTNYQRGWQTVDPFPELEEVDPRGAGRRSSGGGDTGKALLVCAALWIGWQALKRGGRLF